MQVALTRKAVLVGALAVQLVTPPSGPPADIHVVGTRTVRVFADRASDRVSDVSADRSAKTCDEKAAGGALKVGHALGATTLRAPLALQAVLLVRRQWVLGAVPLLLRI